MLAWECPDNINIHVLAEIWTVADESLPTKNTPEIGWASNFWGAVHTLTGPLANYAEPGALRH